MSAWDFCRKSVRNSWHRPTTSTRRSLPELIEKHAERSSSSPALKGLYAAYNIKREMPDVSLKGVQLDLTLGLCRPASASRSSTTAPPLA